MNRLSDAIAKVRPRIDALDATKRDELDAGMAIEFAEHFAYQEGQARAHVSGTITADEAQIIYASLGEVGSASNGGWAVNTDLATKVVVTQIMAELVKHEVMSR